MGGQEANQQVEGGLARPVIAAPAERVEAEALGMERRHARHEGGERRDALGRERDRAGLQQAEKRRSRSPVSGPRTQESIPQLGKLLGLGRAEGARIEHQNPPDGGYVEAIQRAHSRHLHTKGMPAVRPRLRFARSWRG